MALATRGGPDGRAAAVAAYEHAILIAPKHAVAYNNLAALFQGSPRHRREALRLFMTAYTLDQARYTQFPQMHLNLAGVLVDASRYDEAIWHYSHGLRYRPQFEDTLGRIVHLGQRACDWRTVDRYWPPTRHVVQRVTRRGHRQVARPALSPMHALTLPVSAEGLLALASAHAAAFEAAAAAATADGRHGGQQHVLGGGGDGEPAGEAMARGAALDHGRDVGVLRVGLISSDFKRHPVTILLAPVLSRLRATCPRLHLTLFALNPPPTSPLPSAVSVAAASHQAAAAPEGVEGDAVWWGRLHSAAHAVVPLHNLSDLAAAERIERARLHVLLDLNGLFSRGARPPILAMRPAPLQATHLGYGASTGARFIDLILADRLALPASPAHSNMYTEKFVLLAPSHLPTGHAALFPALLESHPRPCRSHTRRLYGLHPSHASSHTSSHVSSHISAAPSARGRRERAVTFAFFGQHLKLDPQTFARWLAMLRAAPRAVLWMLRWPSSAARLRQYAAAAGVNPSRLVFSDRMAQGEHLCAFRLADIALDSPSYASGATGIDVLWSGVPLLAMAGGLRSSSPTSAASAASTIFQRNAISLVTAAAQPHLQAHSSAGYIELGVGLMRRPESRSEVRRRARDSRRWAPLFDAHRWASGFEVALRAAWEVRAASQGQSRLAMHIVVAPR